MKKTKIICSIGPASDSFEVMKEMVREGMDCARINLSHATREGIINTVDVVNKVREECGVPIAIMYDTKGPEFRTLRFEGDGAKLKKGDTIRMSKNCTVGSQTEFGVNHPHAIDFMDVGDTVLVDNALLELEVIEKDGDDLVLKALGEGMIQDNKTINVPGVDLELDFISDIDRKDIAFAANHECDYLALSFVKTKEDVIAARRIIEEAGGDASIISKIENGIAIQNIDGIIEESDGIMVARGDLGVEVPMEGLPLLQKNIIRKCREKGKFTIVATEMLASMYENSRPSRAEVSDVANAILDGTDCMMLSGETAIGKYPIVAVDVMGRICEYVESTIDYNPHVDYKGQISISDTIAKMVVDAVEFSDIKLVVTPTMSGFTAGRISNLRPNSMIMACCPSSDIAAKVMLNFAVKPVVTDIYKSTDEMVESATEIAKKQFNLSEGDLIVVTGGFPLGRTRATNYIRIVEI